jgi:uncharacterized membrane protein
MDRSVVFALVAMFGYGISAILLKLATNDSNFVIVTLVSSATMTVTALCFSLFYGGTITVKGLEFSIVAGLISGIGFLAFIAAGNYGKVSISSSLRGLSFVVTAILGLLLLHESLSLSKIFGIITAFIAIVLLSF